MADFTRVQKNGALTTVANTTGTTPTWAGGTPTAGNLLLVVINARATTTGHTVSLTNLTAATTAGGFTAVSGSPFQYWSTDSSVAVLWKIATGSEAQPGSPTCGATTAWEIETYEFSTPDGWPSNPLDQSVHSSASSTAVASIASGAAASIALVPDELIFAFLGMGTTSATSISITSNAPGVGPNDTALVVDNPTTTDAGLTVAWCGSDYAAKNAVTFGWTNTNRACAWLLTFRPNPPTKIVQIGPVVFGSGALSTGTLTGTLPSAPLAGNTVVILAYLDNGNGAVESISVAGFTAGPSYDEPTHGVMLAGFRATGQTATSYTVSYSGNVPTWYASCVVIELLGTGWTTDASVTAITAITATPQSAASGSATPTVSNDVALLFTGWNDNDSGVIPDVYSTPANWKAIAGAASGSSIFAGLSVLARYNPTSGVSLSATQTMQQTVGNGGPFVLQVLWLLKQGGTPNFQSLTGSMTPAGAQAKSDGKALAASETPAGALVRLVAHVLTAALTPGGALARRLARGFTATLTPAGAVAAARVFLRALTATLTPGGGIGRSATKALAATDTPGGTVARALGYVLAATVTPTGTAKKALQRALAGVAGAAGTLVTPRVRAVALTASEAPAALIARLTSKRLTATVTPGGGLVKLARKTLTASEAVTACLTGYLSVTYLVTLAATLTPAGVTSKRLTRLLTAAAGFLGSFGTLVPPSYKQNWTTMTAAFSAETSRTLTFDTSGTGGTNPTAGDLLTVFVYANSNTGGIFAATPSGWALRGQVQTTGVSTIAAYTKTAVGGGTDTFAAANFGGTGAAVSILLIGLESAHALFDIVTLGAQSSPGTPWNTPTGTGTAASTNELQYLAGTIDDAILAPSAPAGFTGIAGAADGNHGDGGNSFGGTYACARANALTSSTAIASQTFTWSGGSGTVSIVGMSVVLRTPGQNYTQALSAALAAAGVGLKRTTAPLAATLAPGGIFAKLTRVVLAASASPAGSLARALARAFAGSASPAGVLVRSTRKVLAGTETPAGALAAVHSALVVLAAAFTPGGALTKRTSKVLAGTETPAAVLSRTTDVLVAATLTPSATLVRRAGKALTAAVAPGSTLARLLTRAFAGVLTPAGTLSVAHVRLLVLTASLAAAGAVARRTGKVVAAVETPTATLARTTGIVVAGVLAPAAALARRTGVALVATEAASGALGAAHVALVALAATLGPQGAVRRGTAAVFTATVAPGGGLARTVGRQLAAALTPAADVARRTGRAFVAAVAPAGSLQRTTLVALAGAVAASAVFAGHKTGSFVVNLAASLAPAGAIGKRTNKALAALVAVAAVLVDFVTHRLPSTTVLLPVAVRGTVLVPVGIARTVALPVAVQATVVLPVEGG